jgi:hypothetical protein
MLDQEPARIGKPAKAPYPSIWRVTGLEVAMFCSPVPGLDKPGRFTVQHYAITASGSGDVAARQPPQARAR